jgi:Dolichyl-phosphate-mannose-protein mannosyltransferase
MPGKTTQRPAGGWLARALPAFGVIFGALWLLHLPLLRLPYFWDEAGYFIPAARDLLLAGDLIPHTTLSNAHPPLVMLWLALAWKLAGYSPLVTRTAMLLVAASGLTALWLLGRRVASSGTAAAAVLLTALSPTVFSQSAMAQLDIAAFALVLWTLYAHICGKRWQAVAFAGLAAVAKETTVAVTLTLFAADLLSWFADRWWPAWAAKWCLPRRNRSWLGLAQSAAWLLALLPLAGWYAYHFHRTGHVLGNPDYLRYNVGATVTPWRILIAGWMRLWHAMGYMNLFVLTAAALLLRWNARAAGAMATSHIRQQKADVGHLPEIAPNIQLLLGLVVLAQVAEFSVVGGALLARYMIPAIPLVILLAVHVLRRYAPRWQWWIAGCAAAFVAALLFNPPWFISPEDNLTWTRFVEMHQRAARYVEQRYAGERILTAWPASDELNRPFLGYVERTLTVVHVENFTAGEMLRAAQQEESFDVVVAFSSKFEPLRGWMPHIAGWTRAQMRYFDFHQDLAAASIARLLHGRIVWQEASPGEWIAVIEIDKVRDASARFESFKVSQVSEVGAAR